jgi:hypothetical protein
MAELDVGPGDPFGAEEPRPAEALSLRGSGLNVRYLDVALHDAVARRRPILVATS